MILTLLYGSAVEVGKLISPENCEYDEIEDGIEAAETGGELSSELGFPVNPPARPLSALEVERLPLARPPRLALPGVSGKPM